MIAFMTCSMTKIVTPLAVDPRGCSSIAPSIFGRVQARHDLVEEEKLRVHRERLGELEALQVRDRQLRGGLPDPVLEADPRRGPRSARSRASAAVRSRPRAPNIAPIATLSRTVSCFKGLTTWNVRAIPSRPIA